MGKKMNDTQRFRNHLEDSKNAVWQVARWLSDFGYPTQVNPTFVTPSYEDRLNFTDDGDIYINQRIEVKSLSADFTCAEDWPFKDKFLVCAKHSFDNAKPKPFMYIYLNKNKTHIAIVKADTKPLWYVEKRKDSRYDSVTQEFYLVPLSSVKFVGFNK
jgi:hypothetical protein